MMIAAGTNSNSNSYKSLMVGGKSRMGDTQMHTLIVLNNKNDAESDARNNLVVR